MVHKCQSVKDKNIIEQKKFFATIQPLILRTFMDLCNCYSYSPILVCHGYYDPPVHNCQTKNGLNPLKIAANVDLTRWKVALVGRLYSLDRTLLDHDEIHERHDHGVGDDLMELDDKITEDVNWLPDTFCIIYNLRWNLNEPNR